MDKKRRHGGRAQPRRGRPTRWAVAGAAVGVTLLATLPGCTAPAVEGYQLQAPPEGFLYSVQQEPGGSAIPGRSPAGGGFWYGDIHGDGPRTTVEITRYRGGLGEGDAAAARDARAQLLGSSPYNRLGPLRTLTLADAHAASAWTEELWDEYGRFRSLQVTAVVSYDTVSFALELDTSVPERMREAHLDSILATFGLGVTAVNWVLVAAAAGLAALLLAALFRRASRGQPTDYRMARVPKGPASPGPGGAPPGS